MIHGIATIALLALLLPIGLSFTYSTFELSASAILLLLVTWHAALRLALMAWIGTLRPISFTFWCFVYIWGGLTPFLQTGTDTFPWAHPHTESEEFRAAVITLLAVFAFEGGAWLARRRFDHRPPTTYTSFSLRALTFVALGVIGTTIAGIVWLGGPSALMQQRGDVVEALFQWESVALRHLAEGLVRPPPFIVSLVIVYVLVTQWQRLSTPARLGMVVLLGPYAVLNTITNYPIALARLWLGTVILSFVFVLIPTRKWTMSALILGFVTSLVFVFPYTDHFRGKGERAALERYLVLPEWTTINEALTHKADYDPFQNVVGAVEYVDKRGIMWGRNLLGAALFWYPRAWWPEKPIGSGTLVAVTLGHTYWNVSAPLWMEGYLAFGYGGVIAVLLLYGYGVTQLELRYLYQRLLQSPNSTLGWFVPFWAAYQTFFLRGDLINGVAFCSVSILVCAMLIHWRRRQLHTPLSVGAEPALIPVGRT